jgi:hypothetical protein
LACFFAASFCATIIERFLKTLLPGVAFPVEEPLWQRALILLSLQNAKDFQIHLSQRSFDLF